MRFTALSVLHILETLPRSKDERLRLVLLLTPHCHFGFLEPASPAQHALGGLLQDGSRRECRVQA